MADAEQAAAQSQLLARLASARALLSAGPPEAAVAELQRLAPALPDAALALVACLRHGIGVDAPRPRRAWRLLEPLLEAEYPPAMVVAALWLRDTNELDLVNDRSVAKDDVRSVRLLERVLEIEPANVEAMCALGVARQHGSGCEVDIQAGLELLVCAAKTGHLDAMYWVGMFMMDYRKQIHTAKSHGLPVAEEDYAVAKHGLHMLTAVAGFGHPYAHLTLADLCRQGDTPVYLRYQDCRTKEQRRRKADWHEQRAAELGAPRGYLNLALIWSEDLGASDAQLARAVEYFKQAVAGGVVSACDALGFHYEKGGDRGNPDFMDAEAAFAMYLLGHEYGDPSATLHLGEAYDDALGTACDYVRAEELYKKALERAREEGNKGVAGNAHANLVQLYTARILLDGSPERYMEKLNGTLGEQKASARLRKVGGILGKISEDPKPTRRASKGNAAPAADDPDSVRAKLEEFVGMTSAKKLLEIYHSGDGN
jgi:TPR repeat protein